VIGSSSPALAAVSALSFPLIPTWLGIQQKVTDLPPLFVRWVYSFGIFKTNAFSVLRLSIACKLDRESEKTTKSLLLVRRIMHEWMSSCLTAHQHNIGHSVPWVIKKITYVLITNGKIVVPGNMHIKFEVRSFNRVISPMCAHTYTDTHRHTHWAKTVSLPFTPFTWRR